MKDTGNTKRWIEKHIYSSNRNKIQVTWVRQELVNRKLRVQLGWIATIVHYASGVSCDCVTWVSINSGELLSKLH